MTVSSCKCSRLKGKAQGVSWWSTLFIAVILKYPFCIMAYSGAITMYGGADMYVNESKWVPYVLILGMIMLNFCDIRTYCALVLVISGVMLVLLAHRTLLTLTNYHVGILFLLLGIWVNGSFLSIIRKTFKVKYFQNTR